MSPDEGNTVLTQDDIDSLIERTAAKDADEAPAPQAEAAVAEASPEPEESKPKISTVAASPGVNVSRDLADRIETLEAGLEKLSGAGGADPKLQETVTALTQQLQTLSGQVNEMLKHLPNTLGYGARETFQCGACQSKSNVASRVVCTSCNTETYIGWWPQQ